MRILSLNAWGGAMFDALSSWLPSCEADVVCLQEVTRTTGLRGWTTFADGERTLPQRADLFTDVSDVLPGYQGYFVASDSGPVTDSSGRRWQQQFGIATFVRGHIPVLSDASTFIHGSFTEHEDWAATDRPRAAHVMRVTAPGGGAGFTVAHLHGLRDSAGKGDTPARREQAERITGLVSTVREATDLVVTCGDFNILPDSETFDVLTRVGLVDLVGCADTRTSHYGKPVRHASYMLVSDPSKVQDFQIVAAPEVSDHRPLVLDL